MLLLIIGIALTIGGGVCLAALASFLSFAGVPVGQSTWFTIALLSSVTAFGGCALALVAVVLLTMTSGG